MKRVPAALAMLCALFAIPAPPARAFQKEGGPAKGCTECHTLTREEAAAALGPMADNVVDVVPGPFPGIWEVDIARGAGRTPSTWTTPGNTSSTDSSSACPTWRT